MMPSDHVDEVLVPPVEFGAHNVAEVRDQVGLATIRSGLDARAGQHVVQAVAEALANAILHGGPLRWVTVRRLGDCLQVEVHDNGAAQRQLLIPRQQPAPDAERGRGLWLMAEFMDSVVITADGAGTVVRLEVTIRS